MTFEVPAIQKHSSPPLFFLGGGGGPERGQCRSKSAMPGSVASSVQDLKLGGLLFKSLPNDKSLDWSKLKAFADDKIDVNEKLKFGLERLENIVEKGENAGYQHFLLIPQCFQKVSFSRSLKVRIKSLPMPWTKFAVEFNFITLKIIHISSLFSFHTYFQV